MPGNEYHGSVLSCIAWLSARKDGEFEIKPWREKRSRDANAYYWVLVSKIAEVMNKPKEEIHRQMLTDYGTWDTNADGAPKWVILPENEPLPLDGYYFDTKAKVTVKGENSGEEIGHAYIVIRGSHTYNTKEMSDLINGVVQEAQNLDIETIPPAEIEEMCRLWGQKNE